MKHITIIAAFCVLISASLAQMAKADSFSNSTQQNSSPFTVKIGAFIPTNDSLREWYGYTWARLTGEYALTSPNSNGQASIYLDIYGCQAEHDYVQSQVNETDTAINGSLGITLSTLSNPGKNKVLPYVSASGGFALNTLNTNLTFADYSGSASQTMGAVAFKLGGGLNIKNTFIIEGDYSDYGSVNGHRFNGYGISIGYHI
jgi:hypothetical protein